MLVVAVCPMLVGGNRPIFWLGFVLLTGLVGLVYAVRLAQVGSHLRVRVGEVWFYAALLVALCLFLVVQTLPLGELVPATRTPTGQFTARSISVASDATLLMAVQLLGYGVFFFLMLQATANAGRVQRILDVLFLVIAGYALFGLAMFTQFGDTLIGIEKWAYKGSVTGPFVNRNSFATFLAMGLATGAVLFVDALANWRRDVLRPALIVVGCFSIAAALALTDSRMGAAVGVLGLFIGLVAGALRAGWGVARASLIAAAILAGSGVLLFIYGSGMLERLFSVEASASSRWALYGQVWAMVASRPWLGFGGGSFELAFPLFHEQPVGSDFVWSKAHSTYLSLWAELGLVAGSVPILILLMLGLKATRNALRSDRWVPGLAAAACLTVVAVHSTVDFSLEIPADTFVLLTVLAAGWHDHSAKPKSGAKA